MALIPINSANIQLAIQNDANRLRETLAWVQERNSTYSLNMTTANMTAAGIATADQNAVLAFIADLARLQTFMTGTLPAVAGDVRVDIAGVLGVM